MVVKLLTAFLVCLLVIIQAKIAKISNVAIVNEKKISNEVLIKMK